MPRHDTEQFGNPNFARADDLTGNSEVQVVARSRLLEKSFT